VSRRGGERGSESERGYAVCVVLCTVRQCRRVRSGWVGGRPGSGDAATLPKEREKESSLTPEGEGVHSTVYSTVQCERSPAPPLSPVLCAGFSRHSCCGPFTDIPLSTSGPVSKSLTSKEERLTFRAIIVDRFHV